MSDQPLIAGLDIGSSAIRIAVGQPSVQAESHPHIVGVAEVPSQGISRGVVTSIDDAVSSISACLEKAERIAGVSVQRVLVGISGSHITAQSSRGVVAVAKPNGEISEADVERAIEAARTVATPPNYEILHVIPKSFTVDGQAGIRDPVGMTGVRLEVDTQIIQGLSTQIKNLTKAIFRTGLDVEDLVLAILAAAEAVVSPRSKQLGVAAVNIGGSTTSLAVYEEGDLLHMAILPIGSEHITSDIAIGLRISIDAAERIKLEHGTALAKDVGKREEIELQESGGAGGNVVSKRYVSEIIEARVEEIVEKIDAELKKVGRSGMLPAGIVLTGGGSKLPGIVEVFKHKLRLPAAAGFPVGVTSTVDKANDVTFTTAIGLVLWGNQLAVHRGSSGGGILNGGLRRLPKAFDRVLRTLRLRR
ncbi:MAG: cell division protein FtsA [Patescibacteria group bacterium]|nr:cell division protein FtsA [Patescibacteria group bacterium]